MAACGWSRSLGQGWRDRKGVSAVEFALIAPIFCLLMAGATDLGGMINTRFTLDGAVSAGANYSILNAAKVTSSNATTLAGSIAAIVATASTTASGTVVVNNGPTSTITNGAVSTAGSTGNADLCFCPTVANSAVTWGSSTSCGTTCASGGLAGKFVSIAVNRTYTPILVNYGMTQNGAINVRAMIQVQ